VGYELSLSLLDRNRYVSSQGNLWNEFEFISAAPPVGLDDVIAAAYFAYGSEFVAVAVSSRTFPQRLG